MVGGVEDERREPRWAVSEAKLMYEAVMDSFTSTALCSNARTGHGPCHRLVLFSGFSCSQAHDAASTEYSERSSYSYLGLRILYSVLERAYRLRFVFRILTCTTSSVPPYYVLTSWHTSFLVFGTAYDQLPLTTLLGRRHELHRVDGHGVCVPCTRYSSSTATCSRPRTCGTCTLAVRIIAITQVMIE